MSENLEIIEKLREKLKYLKSTRDRFHSDLYYGYLDAIYDVEKYLKELEFPKEPPANYDGYLDSPNLKFI